jgi:hypothetical protein
MGLLTILKKVKQKEKEVRFSSSALSSLLSPDPHDPKPFALSSNPASPLPPFYALSPSHSHWKI